MPPSSHNHMSLPPGYSLRAGTLSDTRAIARLYLSAFQHDALISLCFPGTPNPSALQDYLHWHFATRVCTPGWVLTVVEDDTLNVPVAFTCWHSPRRCWSPMSFIARWYYKLRMRLASIDASGAARFAELLQELEPEYLTTERRRNAWYLSTLGVLPRYQGEKLGGALMRHGLRRVDENGEASYLIALKGVEGFYPKFGYREVFRVNVGALAAWDGGSVMFRE